VPRFFAGLIAAGALFVAGTAFDALGTHGPWTDGAEEAFETAGALAVAAVFARQAFAYRPLDSHTWFLADSTSRGIPKGGARELESKAPRYPRVHLRPH
jgi:hypothetical protein